MKNNISAARKAKGFTQDQLAELIGVKKSYVSKLETGYHIMRADRLKQIADVLNVSTDYLLGRIEKK